ncbi:MAG: HAD family phosphatase [Mangrovimonas sp.]|nr:HAD family phosphatase [Mangrovimonas sp.]
MIKTIIFDFGDVFINLDKSATEKGLKSLGLSKFSKEMTSMNQVYEMGLISSHTFLEYYLEQVPKSNAQDLIDSWNSILLDFPLHRLEFLKQLKEDNRFQLILLSNTNELHIDSVKKNLSFYEEFKACFDKFYLSHEIGFRKPEAAIYDYILCENKLLAGECFFIDDTKENTESASKLGLQTWNINPLKDDITELFTKNPQAFD